MGGVFSPRILMIRTMKKRMKSIVLLICAKMKDDENIGFFKTNIYFSITSIMVCNLIWGHPITTYYGLVYVYTVYGLLTAIFNLITSCFFMGVVYLNTTIKYVQPTRPQKSNQHGLDKKCLNHQKQEMLMPTS